MIDITNPKIEDFAAAAGITPLTHPPAGPSLNPEMAALAAIAGEAIKGLAAGTRLHSITFAWMTRDDGTDLWAVYPHSAEGASQGIGDTPAEAFADGLRRISSKQEAA